MIEVTKDLTPKSQELLSVFCMHVIGEGLPMSWSIKTSRARGLGAIAHWISLTFVQMS